MTSLTSMRENPETIIASIVEFKEICLTYSSPQTDVPAVRDLTLRLVEGEVCLIEGRSGSGKSSVLKLAGCLLKPTSGELNVSQQDVMRLNEEQLATLRRSLTGFVFQSPKLVPHLSVLENIALGASYSGMAWRDSLTEAEIIAEKLGLADLLGRFPQQTSGGQQQRISVARALVKRPRLIVADEPTANADDQHCQLIMEALVEEARRRKSTIIIATHDKRLRDFGDSVYKLRGGRLT